MEIPIDLRSTEAKSFICSVSLCGAYGYESIEAHKSIEEAKKSIRTINRSGCCGACTGSHYLVRIPRGHIRNLKKRTNIRQSAYLRWLIREKIVWRIEY